MKTRAISFRAESKTDRLLLIGMKEHARAGGYRINGHPALDPAQRQKLDELVTMTGLDDADTVRRRFHGLRIITDDNMGVEWR